MKITAKTKLCMSIGDPIAHSKGPELYNAVYRELGMHSEFVYVSCRVKIEDVGDFIKGVRAMGIRGISCTLPHKVEVMKYLDKIDPLAAKIGAVNTIVNDDGVLTGYNTDVLGAVLPLKARTSLEGKKVGLIGAGGAARAFAFGLVDAGALVTIYNRTLEKAQELASASGSQAASMKDIVNIKNMDIIVNATSIGMQPDEDVSPLDKSLFSDKQIVMDAVYTPPETRFLREAKAAGAQCVQGTEMYIEQGRAQFKLYTGRDLPAAMMRQALETIQRAKENT